MCKIGIRDFDPGDFMRLYEIDGLCFPAGVAYSKRDLLSYIKHPDSITRVATREGHIVGFAVGIVECSETGHIITIDIIPEARRQGVGRMLMQVLHEEFGRRGLLASLLEVSTQNAVALRFYQGLCYRRLGRFRSYYRNGEDAFQMICFLRRSS